MLIEIHMIQNHSPANLNRDDLGAPKTCYFGGVIRARISSQCLKRSIRMSPQFENLRGGIRTRRLAQLLGDGDEKLQKKAEAILKKCGILPKGRNTEATDQPSEESKMLIYTTHEAIRKMRELLSDPDKKEDALAKEFPNLIASKTAVPDIALSGRMLEPEGNLWKGINTTVEAALQVSHAISTHEAKLEVDYYVAADDIPGPDAGAGYVDEAMFSSACFYKYFSIHWEQLLKNLEGFHGDKKTLAAHTVGAFLRAAALVTPTGKQNSFAAHNPPDGILVEIRDYPLSYANAFAKPVERVKDEDIVARSITRLAQYIYDLDTGYGKPQKRFWFSPNLRFPLKVVVKRDNDKNEEQDIVPGEHNFKSLNDLVPAVIKAIDDSLDWDQVQRVIISGVEP